MLTKDQIADVNKKVEFYTTSGVKCDAWKGPITLCTGSLLWKDGWYYNNINTDSIGPFNTFEVAVLRYLKYLETEAYQHLKRLYKEMNEI